MARKLAEARLVLSANTVANYLILESPVRWGAT